MFGTRTMNFYCNGSSGCASSGGCVASSSLKRNSRTFNSPIYSSTGIPTQILTKKSQRMEKTLDFLSGLTTTNKIPFWIQLLILLILLPNPGIQVRSEPQPQSQQRLPGKSNGSSLVVGRSVNVTTTMMTAMVTGGDALGDDNPFENNTFSNTTVPLGDTAFLKCSVRNLGERSVSWIRRRDMHIISVDKLAYTNDERFHVLNTEGSEDWVLQIKYVQKRDNGTYECQVSTGKGLSSYLVHLFVAVPEAFILGNGEYHIQEGSVINLVCIVEKSPKPPDYIFWFHNDRMINYDFENGRNIRIVTETGSKTHSRLTIDNAQTLDSGNYTCHISNTEPASTLVFIESTFTGDKMAAIQRRKSSACSLQIITYLFLLPLLLTFLNHKCQPN